MKNNLTPARSGVSLRKMHENEGFSISPGGYLGTCSERALTLGEISPKATSLSEQHFIFELIFIGLAALMLRGLRPLKVWASPSYIGPTAQ